MRPLEPPCLAIVVSTTHRCTTGRRGEPRREHSCKTNGVGLGSVIRVVDNALDGQCTCCVTVDTMAGMPTDSQRYLPVTRRANLMRIDGEPEREEVEQEVTA